MDDIDIVVTFGKILIFISIFFPYKTLVSIIKILTPNLVTFLSKTGGDHTFLKASALLKDDSKPILGLNTVPEDFLGYLNSVVINYHQRHN